MGQQNTKILTKVIEPQQLLRKEPVEVGLHFYPFKQYSQYQFNAQTNEVVLKLDKPYQDCIKVRTNIYNDLQKAVFEKTFDMRFNHVLFDTFNFDKSFLIGFDLNQPISLAQRKFKSYNSQLYKNILYEKHIYETINKIQCQSLIKLNDSFSINSCLQQQYPYTYFFVFQNVEVNLSQIIRYRRQNNCQWFVKEFQKLCWDLVSALDQLHQNNITHNDIRPCNVYYSLQKECYVLGEFSNALKTDPIGTFLNVKTRTHPSFFIPQKQLDTDKLKQNFINHKRRDIYSLGMTLMCAFYMIEPVQRKLAAPINRTMEEQYEIMKTLRRMVHKSQYPLKIGEIKQQLQKCNKIANLSYLIESIRFRFKPKTKHLPMIQAAYASAYKRLGLWQEWRNSLQQAFQAQEGHIAQTQAAEYYKQLSRVQKLLQNHENADKLGQKAAMCYLQIGKKYSEEGNATAAFSVLNNGMDTLKYCLNPDKIVLVKIFQGLSLLHAEKQQFTESMACLNQSKRVLNNTHSQQLIDFYEIKQKTAQIYQIHRKFEDAQIILNQLVDEAKSQSDYSRQIQFFKRLGQNQIKRVLYAKANPEQKNNQMVNSTAKSFVLKESYVLHKQDFRNSQSMQNRENRIYEYQKAEQYFLEASNLIQSKLQQFKLLRTSIRKNAINWNVDQFEINQIQNQNLQIQNLNIWKFLGQIKYREGLIQRAQDYFYKILSELEKLLKNNCSQQFKQEKQKQNIKSKNINKLKQSIFLNLEEQDSAINFDSRKSDFSTEKQVKNLTVSKNRRISINKSTKSLVKPKKLMSKGDLIKLKADIQCSIALCKQQHNEYAQMLDYYNKSLASYKSYFGQYHNKVCGIIIGSIAFGYQKIGQYNKAISCVQLANQILRDILPANSPDLMKFQAMKRNIFKDELNASKVAEDNLMASMLQATIGIKPQTKKQKKRSLKSMKSIDSNHLLVQSVDLLNKLKHIDEDKDNFLIEQCQSLQNQQVNSNSSYHEVQLPLKVSYLNKESNHLIDMKSEWEWGSSLQQSRQMNKSFQKYPDNQQDKIQQMQFVSENLVRKTKRRVSFKSESNHLQIEQHQLQQSNKQIKEQNKNKILQISNLKIKSLE